MEKEGGERQGSWSVEGGCRLIFFCLFKVILVLLGPRTLAQLTCPFLFVLVSTPGPREPALELLLGKCRRWVPFVSFLHSGTLKMENLKGTMTAWRCL